MVMLWKYYIHLCLQLIVSGNPEFNRKNYWTLFKNHLGKNDYDVFVGSNQIRWLPRYSKQHLCSHFSRLYVLTVVM